MNELLDNLAARIESLENNRAAIMVILQANDAVQTALTKKCEEQQEAIDAAAEYAEESAREIQKLKDAIEQLTGANLKLEERVRGLVRDVNRFEAGLP